jgi:hypothetical protein
MVLRLKNFPTDPGSDINQRPLQWALVCLGKNSSVHSLVDARHSD